MPKILSTRREREIGGISFSLFLLRATQGDFGGYRRFSHLFRRGVAHGSNRWFALYRSFGYDFSIRKACEYVFTPKSSTEKERNAMKEQVLNILQDIRPDVDFENEKLLIDGGVLDSFDIISIVQEFNETFGIDIDVEDLEPANFNTIEAMMELIEKLQNE